MPSPKRSGPGRHFRRRALVIDPAWGYSTFVGGTASDEANGVAVDSAGNAYVVGDTTSVTFAAVPGNKQFRLNAQSVDADAFVTKIDPTGNTALYTTFIGGKFGDYGVGIAVANVGGQVGAFITGYTFSTDFYTKNPWQAQLGGKGDAFVARLTPDGQGAVADPNRGSDQPGDSLSTALPANLYTGTTAPLSGGRS